MYAGLDFDWVYRKPNRTRWIPDFKSETLNGGAERWIRGGFSLSSALKASSLLRPLLRSIASIYEIGGCWCRAGGTEPRGGGESVDGSSGGSGGGGGEGGGPRLGRRRGVGGAFQGLQWAAGRLGAPLSLLARPDHQGRQTSRGPHYSFLGGAALVWFPSILLPLFRSPPSVISSGDPLTFLGIPTWVCGDFGTSPFSITSVYNSSCRAILFFMGWFGICPEGSDYGPIQCPPPSSSPVHSPARPRFFLRGGGGWRWGGRWLALNKTAGEEIFLWGNFSCSLYCLNLYGFLMSTRFMNQRGKLKFHLLISVFRWTICGSLEGGWHLCAWIEYWWAPPDGNHLDFYSMVLISWLEDEWTAWNVESPCLPSCLRRWRTRRDPMCLKEDAGGWHWPRKAHILGISGSSIV